MTKKIKAVLLLSLAAIMLTFSACHTIQYKVPEKFEDGDQLLMPSEGELIAIFDTTLGEMRVRLFPSQAPMAVENFMKLAQRGYYDGNLFHRVVENELVQSGDPSGTGQGGDSIWGKGFGNEFDTGLYHYKGALSYAKAHSQPKNEKNRSQFFFVTKDAQYYDVDYKQLLKKGYSEKAAQGYLENSGNYRYDAKWNNYSDENSYVVFGQLYEGWDVLEKINSAQTENQTPTEQIKINKITITTYSKEA